jgi:hypothetical protein
VAKIINLHFDSSLDQNGTTTSEKNKESEKKEKRKKAHSVGRTRRNPRKCQRDMHKKPNVG